MRFAPKLPARVCPCDSLPYTQRTLHPSLYRYNEDIFYLTFCFLLDLFLKPGTRWQRSAIGQRGHSSDFLLDNKTNPITPLHNKMPTDMPKPGEHAPKINQGLNSHFFNLTD